MAGHLRPILGLWVCALALTGCAHHKHLQSSPQQLYQTAHHDMDEYNFNGAIKVYEQLTAIFPFTDQAHQAQLDLIYAYYRAGETDSAIDACDTFIRENPTHPRVDYAYYMEGMTNFEKQPEPHREALPRRPLEAPPHHGEQGLRGLPHGGDGVPEERLRIRCQAEDGLSPRPAGFI